MSELVIKNITFKNVPDSKVSGTQLTTILTQSNVADDQTVEEYINSAAFYKLVNAIDIDWNGIQVDNVEINDTSDLINWIATKAIQVPSIGENGNWFIGDVDTEVKAAGEQGPQGETGPQGELGETGAQGEPGINGKSAYDIYVDNINTYSFTSYDSEEKTNVYATGKVEVISKTDTYAIVEVIENTPNDPNAEEFVGQQFKVNTLDEDAVIQLYSLEDTALPIYVTVIKEAMTEEEWLASLKGSQGSAGALGEQGYTPYIDETTGNWFINGVDTGVHAQGPLGNAGVVDTSQFYTKEEIQENYALKTDVPVIWTGTQAEYDALDPIVETTIYIIKEES